MANNLKYNKLKLRCRFNPPEADTVSFVPLFPRMTLLDLLFLLTLKRVCHSDDRREEESLYYMKESRFLSRNLLRAQRPRGRMTTPTI